MEMEEKEMVSHPSHYVKGGIECFDVIKAFFGMDAFESFCLSNSLKYIMRCKEKGKYLEDIKKASFYLNEIIKMHEENG
jgi:hypothetical protein